MNKLVSINCITYNHEHYITDALEGFFMQKTDFDFEIIIGEDCSTDNTNKIIEKYMKKYPHKIHLITSEKNVGWRKNAKKVLDHSKGKYIALCEGDDYWTDPYKLQKQVDYMESHPECSFCFHAAKVVNVDKKLTKINLRPYKESGIAITEEIIRGGGEFCPTPSLFFVKKFVDNPPFFYNSAHVGDYPLQMWLASQGSVYYIDEFMAAYRTGVEGSWTNLIHSGPNITEKAINVKRADIQLLEEFNQFTNEKYAHVIEETKLKKEFQILLLQNSIEELKNEKFKNQYKELSHLEKIKLYARVYFPNMYSKALNIKRAMNK